MYVISPGSSYYRWTDIPPSPLGLEYADDHIVQIPDCGLLCDLLWSDPDKDITGWSENDRGVSFTFGPDVVSRFLQKHDMDLICRAHQVVEDGYEFFSKRQLVTLFSAPNYCGEFDNAGAMMSVDESLLCSFQVGTARITVHFLLNHANDVCLVSRSSSLQRRNKSMSPEEPGEVLDPRPPGSPSPSNKKTREKRSFYEL